MDLSRVSCCTYPLIDRPADEAMRIIAAAGFKKVDLLGRMPHLSLDPKECDPHALKITADEIGVSIANLGTYVGKGFADPDQAEGELEQLKRAIDIAVILGSRSIRVSAGNDDPACINQIVPWFQRGGEYAAEHGVYMGIENHGGGISGSPKLCAELFQKVGSPYFGVLYEPYNLVADGTEYRYALGVMREHVVHVHFKDGIIKGDGAELAMMGEGEIDFPWIMAKLDELGYEGDIALEYELESEPPDTGLVAWFQAFEGMV